MKYDINGWNVVGKHLEKDPDFERKLSDVFGEEFDRSLLYNGGHIMALHHLEKLLATFSLSAKMTDELLNAIVSARCASGCRKDLDGFIDMICRRSVSRKISIPCAELEILDYFQPLHETLRDFMKRVSIDKFSTTLPANSCAFTISTPETAKDLELPLNSVIIVNGDKPAKANEMALFQYRNKNLGIGTIMSLSRLRWTAPIIQIYMR